MLTLILEMLFFLAYNMSKHINQENYSNNSTDTLTEKWLWESCLPLDVFDKLSIPCFRTLFIYNWPRKWWATDGESSSNGTETECNSVFPSPHISIQVSQVKRKNNFCVEIVQFICQDAGQTEPKEPFDRTNTEL